MVSAKRPRGIVQHVLDYYTIRVIRGKELAPLGDDRLTRPKQLRPPLWLKSPSHAKTTHPLWLKRFFPDTKLEPC